MSEDLGKTDWIPPEQRKSAAGPLSTDEMEYLDRLVEKGEGLLLNGLQFSQAEALLKTGHAEVASTYGEIRRIVPTEMGRTLHMVRERMRLERINAVSPYKGLPLKSEVPTQGEEK